MTQSIPSAVLEPAAAPDPDIIIRYLLAEIYRLRSALKQLSGEPVKRKTPKRSVLNRLFLFPEGCEMDMPISGSLAGENPVQPGAFEPLLLSAPPATPNAPSAKKPLSKKRPQPGEPYQLTLFDMDTI